MNLVKKNKHVILVGEGIHQHVLHGNFKIDVDANEFSTLVVTSQCELKHETPSGSFAEHNTLIIDKGNWVMGKQVEYNPFTREVSMVWD